MKADRSSRSAIRSSVRFTRRAGSRPKTSWTTNSSSVTSVIQSSLPSMLSFPQFFNSRWNSRCHARNVLLPRIFALFGERVAQCHESNIPLLPRIVKNGQRRYGLQNTKKSVYFAPAFQDLCTRLMAETNGHKNRTFACASLCSHANVRFLLQGHDERLSVSFLITQ